MSDLTQSKRFWDAHAERDPLWAVLSDEGKENRNWNVRRFFETGVNEIAEVLYQLDQRNTVVRRERALDFGCGVGRLTQALAPHFRTAVGVDISPKMIDTALSLNKYPDRVSYVCNDAPDLGVFADRSFDFVYSNLVLQHIEPHLSTAYIREFLRLLRPSGVLVFQLPSHLRREDELAIEARPKAMPDDAYDAALLVRGVPSAPLRPGTSRTIEVDVTNVSAYSWNAAEFGTFSVGNHWLDGGTRRMLLRDDGRTPLPKILRAGETCRLALTINVPNAEGKYACEIDLAHEAVRWFKDRGSAVATFSVEARDSSSSAAAVFEKESEVRTISASADRQEDSHWLSYAPGGRITDEAGEFPMYGVHTDVVLQTIASSRGELLVRTDDYSCREWTSYRYFVRKASSRERLGNA